jgi:predicted  nucleic acid-binding Zn-ribbon protein
MKKQLLLAILMSISSLMTLMGQSAKKSLNYQAVILDPKAIDIPGAGISGQPLSKGKVCLKFTFLNALGNVDYEETQQTTTDEYGLVSISIGTGSYSNGTYKNFENIIWDANVKSMKVSVSYDGCATFKQVSTQALNYTAYALYAEAVDYKNVRDSPTKLSQFSNDIGYLVPKDLDPIKADIKTNTADIKSNTSQIALANQTIADNKKISEDAFLIVNQSIKSIDIKVADNATAIKDNTSSIGTINVKLNDQQNQISDNRNQIAATNNNLNNQIGGLQGQINTTNSTVSNLTGAAEVVSNKSTLVNLGGANPSDQLYPSQKAAKSYIDNAINDAVGSGVPDATTLAPGKVQLSGDLAGTATNPTVPALANKANLASPTFTGTPTAPTQTTGDNSTKLATTAFVTNSLAASAGGVPYTGATQAVNLGLFDLTVNGITVGIGGGNDIRNIAIGSGALFNNTNSGLKNTASGYEALNSNIAGDDNTASGYRALRFNIGNFNTASGSLALGANTSGGLNTAFGLSALSTNITGSNNTAIGSLADVGSGNLTNATAIGYGAVVNADHTIQLGNTDVTAVNTSGNLTVNGITVGRGGGNDIRNIAIGSGALSNNTNSGLKNTASGYQALNSNIEGDDNTASGYRALRFNIGNFNTASGSLALGANTSGGLNTAFGLSALSTNTTGSNNTAIGSLADVGSGNLTNATAIGYGAIVAAGNTIQLGNTAVTTIGGQVAWTAASDRRIKKNIVNSNYGLATVLKLRPVEYNLISNDLRQVGFIAQEVQKLVPEVVTGKEGDLSKGEILGITYSNLVPVLAKAIQEQQKQIEDQNSKIAAQQKQIEELIKLVKGQ